MNLLQETIENLQENGKTMEDVVWIGCPEFEITKQNFILLADSEYDNGYGASHVAQDLLIVGKDWWMERGEYDGSEWWDFHTIIARPSETRVIEALHVEQARGTRCGWVDLADMQGEEK